jgi:hypothetical protein
MSPELVLVQWFHRPDNGKRFSKEDTPDVYEFEVPAGSDLPTILSTGYGQGLPKGSGRAGCVELQTDEGIWSSPTNSRLNPATAIFKTWEELEQEERRERQDG